MTPAASAINGNGRLNANSATKAAVAILHNQPLRKAREPTRYATCTNIALTAGWMPWYRPAIAPAWPNAMQTQDRAIRMKSDGSTNRAPATMPPRVRRISQPMELASCCPCGPGSSMQWFSACRNRFSEIQRLRSTSPWCRMAISPAGPPKLMQPRESKKRKAWPSEGPAGVAGRVWVVMGRP